MEIGSQTCRRGIETRKHNVQGQAARVLWVVLSPGCGLDVVNLSVTRA